MYTRVAERGSLKLVQLYLDDYWNINKALKHNSKKCEFNLEIKYNLNNVGIIKDKLYPWRINF